MPEHYFVGIDWGSREHQLCIVDHNGNVVGERAFQHDGAGLTAMADWILSITAASTDDVKVAIEVPHGPIVESMMEWGFTVYSINPKQLDRCRDRFSPAGAKDDRRDALTLADALRTDRRFFRKLDAPTPQIVELREWTRIANTLTAERTRLVNRLRQQLRRYFPQLLNVESDLTKLWIVELWAVARTPAKARRLRLTTIESFLRRHRVRSVNAQKVQNLLREPALHVAPGTTESVVSHIEILVDQMRLVAKQLATAYAAMDRLSASVAAALETPDHSDVECPSPTAILASLPGVGRVILATLLAEAHGPLRTRDYQALRCLCGVAPATRRSGKTRIVTRRLAAHKRLQDAVYHWSANATLRDPLCKAKYTALRARGHSHARALRGIADRLLAVACAMLTNQTAFDPSRSRA